MTFNDHVSLSVLRGIKVNSIQKQTLKQKIKQKVQAQTLINKLKARSPLKTSNEKTEADVTRKSKSYKKLTTEERKFKIRKRKNTTTEMQNLQRSHPSGINKAPGLEVTINNLE